MAFFPCSFLLWLAIGTSGDQAQGDEQYQFLVGLCDKQMYEMAAKEGDKFLHDFPGHPKTDLARYRLASAQFELGKKSDAAANYRKLANVDGFEFAAEAAFRLGQCELEAKDFDAAIAALTRAEKAIAKDKAKDYIAAPAAFLLGEANFQKGDFTAAEVAYARSLKKDSAGAHAKDARYGIAWCRFRAKDFDGALAAIDDFLNNHGNDPLADEMRFLAGESNLEANHPKEALAAYQKVKDGPFTDAALRGRGFAKVALQDAAGAERDFASLLEKFPESRFAVEAAIQCASLRLKKDDAKGALAAVAGKAANESPEALLWRARAQSKLGDAKTALATVESALQKKPSKTFVEQLQILRGDLLADLGDTSKAGEAYAASASDYALHAAAITKLNANDVQGAAALAKSLLDRFPDSTYRPHAEIVLGEASFQGKNYDEAERHFATAYKNGDDDVKKRAATRLAWCAFLAGNFDAAAKRFQKLADAKDADAATREESLAMLGRAEDQGKHPDRAVAAWSRYLAEAGPDGKHRDEVLLGLVRLATGQDALAAADALLAGKNVPPSALDSVVALSERLRKDGDAKNANTLLERIIARGKNGDVPASARYALAYARYDAGAFDDAARLVEGLAGEANIDPTLRAAALELEVYARVKLNDGAGASKRLAALSSLTKDGKKRLELTRLVAETLKKAGDAKGAEALYADLEKSAKNDPSLAKEVAPEIAAERAYLALDRGDVKGAVAIVESVNPEVRGAIDDAAFFVGEALFTANDFQGASKLYERATHSNKLADKALYKGGFAAIKREDFALAQKQFQRLVTEQSKSPLLGESLYLLGESLYRQNEFEAAMAPLTRLRKEQPKHASIAKALFRLGLCAGKLKRWPEAQDALDDLARRFPDFPNLAEAELWHGRALAVAGNVRAARSALERTIALDKGELAARARIEIGRLHSSAGEHEKALAEFLKVAVLFGGDDVVAESLFCAGDSLEALGDKAKAQKQYEELVAKYPRSPFANDAKQRIERIRTL